MNAFTKLRKQQERLEKQEKYKKIDAAREFGVAWEAVNGPKGLEKVILAAQKGVRKFEDGMFSVLYGKPGNYTLAGKVKNPFDYGINNIIDDLISVDYCDIINYGLSNIKIKNNFNPYNRPDNDSSFASKQTWKIKKLAYDIQGIIDIEGYEQQDEETKKKTLFDRIKEINSKFLEFKSYVSPELSQIKSLTGYSTNSLELTQIFPQLKTILPSIEDKIEYLNQWTDYRQIPISEYQKILTTLDKIRLVCVTIQGLSTPSQLLDIFGNKVDTRLQSIIKQLEKKIDITKPIPYLRKLIKTLQKINLIIKDILKVVSTISTFVNILLLFITIFKKIIIFFKINPTPNLYTWLGLVSTLEDGKTVLKDGVGRFEERLTQIANLLGIIYSVFNSIALELENLITKIRTLIVNLEKCENVDKDIVEELKSELEITVSLAEEINAFLKNKQNSDKNSPQNKIGEYTIQIVTEEVTDESFTLKRRYGVALNNRAQVELSSTPTFASLDSIIIAEVKQLLMSKGLIKSYGQADYTILEQQLIDDVTSYLKVNDIYLQIDYNQESLPDDAQIDPPDNENDDVGIGLNSFLNKLQGGKALRKRVRKARIKNNNELIASLKQDDPQGKYTQDIVKKTQGENNKLKIEELTAEKNKWKAVLATSPSVSGKILAVKKIKEIDQEIYKLKNS